MSFIFGIIDLERKPIPPHEIEALSDAVGWEGFAKQTFLYKNVALGFCHHPERRPKARIYSDEELLVIADIRIYNKGPLNGTFDYGSPEEALAKAFKLWGTDCANHINGDFAAMIFDHHKNEVYLIRDHIGTRPLVYWFADYKLIFASHEFGLVKSRLVKPALSEEKLIDTFFHFKNTYAQTSFKDIFKVIPGHLVSFSTNGLQNDNKYWKPELIKKNITLTFKTSAARLQDLIVMATINRMEPVKTGLHVSGGLDSCGVASIVADHTPNKSLLTGYSWTPETFEDTVEGTNEKEYIDAFSKDKNIKVEYLNLEENETIQNSILPEFETQHIEHPVMKLAEKNNIEM
ncbi:MAG: asparagine synthase-related protein [Bacteroidales bacterium]|nr:asparagine synthase-related protein [Bacteroidales bacterium]